MNHAFLLTQLPEGRAPWKPRSRRWDQKLAHRLSVSLLVGAIMAGSGMRLGTQMQVVNFLAQQHWHRRQDMTLRTAWSRMRSSPEAAALCNSGPPHRCTFQVCANDNWLACSRMPSLRMRTPPRHRSLCVSVPEHSRALVSTGTRGFCF